MRPNERLLQKKWLLRIKTAIPSVVVVASIAEILPEVEAKPVVIPALSFVLILGIIELIEMV